jgi:hypothetical protein
MTVVSKFSGQGVRHGIQKFLVSVPGGHLPSADTISYTHHWPVLLLLHCQLTNTIMMSKKHCSRRFSFMFGSFSNGKIEYKDCKKLLFRQKQIHFIRDVFFTSLFDSGQFIPAKSYSFFKKYFDFPLSCSVTRKKSTA